MQIFRTPEERFDELPGYPFEPKYLEWNGLRMHYIDEGTGPVVLLLHGEPTWSYLYREFIPPLIAAGFRCIAPDLIGFGKSDKVLDEDWYVVERHMESVRFVIDALSLDGISLVVHDWGGPIGLRQIADIPERFVRVFILNTWLHHKGFEYTDGIRRWRQFATGFEASTGDIPTGFVVSNQLNVPQARKDEVKAAYEAPFPDAASKAGARRFPWMLPFEQPVEGNAIDQERCLDALKAWTGPKHFIFGDRDDVFTLDWMNTWAAMLTNTTTAHVPGPHFLQEESAQAITAEILQHLR